MTGNMLRRLFCVVFCIGLLCGCTATTESTESPPEPAKAKAAAKREQVSVEVQWLETVAEIPPGAPELNGRLWEGPMPEGLDFQKRLYFGGQGIIRLIDLDGNLVRWGQNWDDLDAGWDFDDGLQTFEQRNVLMKDAQKIAEGYRASFVIDSSQDLWGWGPNFDLLLYDGDSYHPPREPVKVLSGVKDVAAGDFHTAVVRTDGRLQVWGCQEGWREPVTLQTGAEKICSAYQMMYIDRQHRLYCYPDGWSNHQEPVLLDTDVADVGFLAWNAFLVLKTNGVVEFTCYFDSPAIILSKDCAQLVGTGYITEDGTFWNCSIEEFSPSVVVQPMESICSIFDKGVGYSLHIMKDGEIRVCMGD